MAGNLKEAWSQIMAVTSYWWEDSVPSLLTYVQIMGSDWAIFVANEKVTIEDNDIPSTICD